MNCNIAPEDVISAPDVESIYDVPLNFAKDKLGERILAKFDLKPLKKDMDAWKKMVDRQKNTKEEVGIAIVGKYF